MTDEIKMVTMINNGVSTFLMKSGKLVPGGTITVSEEEAAQVSGYPGVMDISKVVPQAKTQDQSKELAALKDRVTFLQRENEQLRDMVEKLQNEITQLSDAPKEKKRKKA